MYYSDSRGPTDLPPTNYLVTCKTQQTSFRITLPVSPILPTAQLSTNPNQGTVLCKIQLSLPKYIPELWTKIDQAPNQELSNLQNYMIEAKSSLIVVSNASLNLQKQSAFSWIISTTLQVLWTGAGTVPGPQHDTYSRQAEGFGLLAALSFLKQYFSHLPALTMSSSKPIKGHCNNLGLIQQVTKMQTCKTPNPTWMIENNYNLHNKILQTILCIPSTKLHHVKGHQNNTKQVEDLLYKAILNIECDKQAHINLETLPINANLHPTLPASYPHLCIQNQTIICQYPEYIREHN